MNLLQGWCAGSTLVAVCAGPAWAVELVPPEPLKVSPPAAETLKMPSPAEPPIRLDRPTTAPMDLPRQAPSDLRVSPLADAWVVAEIERLKTQAGRATSTAAGKGRLSAAQRRASAEAAWWLGLIYFHGAGVQQSPLQARQWFLTASELGHPLAPAGMALCEIDGCSTPANPAAASPWIARLRRTSAPRALFLDWLRAYHVSPIEMSPAQEPGSSATVALPARELLVRAAAAGDPHAQIEIGLEMAAARNWSAALVQFRKAASRSSAAAANVVIIQEIMARESAPAGDTVQQSRRLLLEAQRMHRGEGLPANYGEALRLYREAERLGSEEAGRMLALIASRPAVGGGVNTEWMRQLAYIDLSQTIPTLGSPAQGLRLQREPSPLYDWLPQAWKDQFTGRARR